MTTSSILLERFYNGSDLASVTDVDNTLAEDLLELAKTHLGAWTYDTRQDGLLLIKLKGALEAAEGYIGKDIFPRTYILNWYGGTLFIPGEITGLQLLRGANSPQDDVSGNVTVRRLGGFVAGGYRLHSALVMPVFTAPQYPNPNPVNVHFTAGFSTITELPSAITSFVFAFVGMLVEMSELSNTGPARYTVDAIPMYLLDPLCDPGMA
jgi:hypothetical protein